MKLIGAILGITLAVVLYGNAGATQPDPAQPPNTIKLISGPFVFPCEDGAGPCTAFMYRMLAGGPPQPSHIVLDACTERLVEVTGWSPVATGYDPTTGMTGVKLDNLNIAPGDTLTFSLIMRGTFSAQPVTWVIKSGQQTITGGTFGPTCSPTAVSLAGLAVSAEGFQWRDLAIMGLVALALLLARWALHDGKRGN